MSQQHPELTAEQAYVDHAYDCLERTREAAWNLRGLTEADLGGTMQARFERNAFDEALIRRLTELDIGNAALVFGRIDRIGVADERAPAGLVSDAADRAAADRAAADRADGDGADGDGADGDGDAPDGDLESFHIGRLAVADEDSEPVVIDWRAPVAEPFYRATGREPMGLARRRHFVVEGRRVLALEDELFGEGHLGIGHDEGLADDGPGGIDPSVRRGLRGHSTLLASLNRARTGSLGDIVATIQAEQDEIIRSPQAGVLVVQGGPGTGKTVVALHRAAYLLYTHRFPLEDQGVLVVGPNRVFLRYIERVLPSLGEAGVHQVVLADLVPGVRFGGSDRGPVAQLKGDVRMVEVIARAIRQRERPLRTDVQVPFRHGFVRLSAAESARIIKAARRRHRRHNAGRRFVESELWAALAASWRPGDATASQVRAAVRRVPVVRETLERMWPVLTPAELLHDLFGSEALLRSVGEGIIDDPALLYRQRRAHVDEVVWSLDDAALLDQAREMLGVRLNSKGRSDESDEIRTYGHIVVDEVQDLTPMQLLMVRRRSLNGSMTIVGDIAQATGPLAPAHWDEVLAHLPDRRAHRVVGLSVGYRIPAQIMDLAVRVMMVATPGLRPPNSVRIGDVGPTLVRATDVLEAMVAEVTRMAAEVPTVAVVVPDDLVEAASRRLDAAGIEHGTARSSGLDRAVTIVPTAVVKGLEIDGVVLVEPAAMVRGHVHGLRMLYVALTRATQRLSVVHAEPLPEPLVAQSAEQTFTSA